MPPATSSLFLHEEILLLALRDEEGTASMVSQHGIAMGGAILAELLLNGRVEPEEGRRKLINLLSREPLGDPVLDECLDRIADAKRRASATAWVQRFANLSKLHHRTAEGLCDKRVLRADEKTVLLIFRRKVYPELNPLPEKRLIERLRKAIFTDSSTVDPRTTVLVSLAHAVDLLRIPFSAKSLRSRKQRIKKLCNGELAGRATREAVEAMQAAIMVTCILPAVTTAAITSSS